MGLAFALLAGLAGIAACGSSTGSDTPAPGVTLGGHHSGSSSGSGSSGGLGSSGVSSAGYSGSSGNNSGGSGSPALDGGGGDATIPPGDDGSVLSPGSDASAGSDASMNMGNDASAGSDAAAAPDSTTCVKGAVTPNEVVMIGDSYLDPAYSNAALDLWADAQNAGSLAMGVNYRHYYQGGASMAWGNPNTQFYIPYQYEVQAKGDITVMNPKDIKVVIMDGGGNDVLIGNNSCDTTAPPGNTSCVTTINNAVNRASSLLQEAATDGVKQIVYFFYPHLDPAGGGLLPTPSPAINETLDYAYPLAEAVCCGAAFTSTATSYSCTGTVAGTQCTFIDTRPAFEGHIADYIKTTDHVHPTPAGAQVIADLIWKVMQDQCIAQ